ncbi:hypothetical protein ACTHSJ_33465 [Paenibacillus cellulositrophicus]|uniref:hypothetical protein n=1 Tax=Paenibacillus cellulositrophicus TaxID=562959 RepID=UPI003F804DFE
MNILKISLSVLVFIQILTTTAYAKNEPRQKTVENYIESINKKNWSIIPDLWVKGNREEMILFLNNKKNEEQKVGLFNIKEAHLIAYKQIPFKYSRIYLPAYIESQNSPQVFYVAVNYKVYKEDKYHINGLNYFLIVTVLEESKRKIILTPLVPVRSVIADGYGFGTPDERTFEERRLKFVD